MVDGFIKRLDAIITFRLSKNEVNSYVGDVFPVKVVSDEDISGVSVKWSVLGDAAGYRSFEGDMRVYSGEEIFEFEKRSARFVKFGALTTVAEEYGREKCFNKGIIVGVLSILNKNETQS